MARNQRRIIREEINRLKDTKNFLALELKEYVGRSQSAEDQLKRVLDIIGYISPDSVCLEPRLRSGPELYGDPYRLPVPQLDSVGRVLRHALETGYLDVYALETRLMEDPHFLKAVHIKYGNKVGCSYMLSGWALRSMPLPAGSRYEDAAVYA